VNGNIFNSKGVHVGIVMDDAVFGLKGQKLYDLKDSNIYKLNDDPIGHLPDARAFGQSDRQTVPRRLGTVCRFATMAKPSRAAFSGGRYRPSPLLIRMRFGGGGGIAGSIAASACRQICGRCQA
jgi:hypothetical protein